MSASKSLTTQQEDSLRQTALAICPTGKGILATDEETDEIGRRFARFNIDNNEQTRRQYRQVLLTSGDELRQHISGIILHHETFFQKTDDGTPFVTLLKRNGIIPGIRVDKGTVPLPGSYTEVTTKGMDDLDERCQQYASNGAKFGKWRCVLSGNPSSLAIQETANTLAKYASICQKNGLVAFIEPEILTTGDQDLARAQSVSEEVLSVVYRTLANHNVFLEGTILKASMVMPGQLCVQKYTPEDIALATVTALRRTVPVAVPGVAFLTGGHKTEQEATINLNAINQVAGKKPWTLTFSFGRALSSSALKAWAGKEANLEPGQRALIRNAKGNGLAVLGKFRLDQFGTTPEEIFAY